MPELEAIPVLIKPLQYGNTPSEDAMMRMKIESETQNDLNNQYSGGGRLRKQKKHYYQRGGGGITIPQFDGDYASPQNPNSASYELNKTLIMAKNAGANDCYATNSCGINAQNGGYRKYNRRAKTKTNKSSNSRKRIHSKKNRRTVKRTLKRKIIKHNYKKH